MLRPQAMEDLHDLIETVEKEGEKDDLRIEAWWAGYNQGRADEQANARRSGEAASKLPVAGTFGG